MTDVILLSHGFQSEYEIGFANGLAHNGTQVTLIGSDNTLVARAATGVHIVNLRGSQDPNRTALAKLFNVLGYIARYLRFVTARRGTRVHMIGQFSTGNTLLCLAEAWLTRLCAGAYVMTVHNILPHGQHTAFNRWAFGLIYRAPAKLMVYTERAASALTREFALPRHTILVVEHGFDRSFPPDPAARATERKRLGFAQDARVALFFGQVVQYKGVDLLLDAFARMQFGSSTRVLIAGRCRDATLRMTLQSAIQSHPHRERITWIDGYVPDDQVAALMQAADCMVMPYRYIDQSGVLFMALSAGLPIVATDVGALAQYIRQGAGEVVPAENPGALAGAIERVLAGNADRASLLAMAARYEWRNTVKAMGPSYAARAAAQTTAAEYP